METAAQVCSSLQEAKDAPFFYEATITFAARLAVRLADADTDYGTWRARTRARMDEGKEMYYLGQPFDTDGVD